MFPLVEKAISKLISTKVTRNVISFLSLLALIVIYLNSSKQIIIIIGARELDIIEFSVREYAFFKNPENNPINNNTYNNNNIPKYIVIIVGIINCIILV